MSDIAEYSVVKLIETISGWPAGTVATVVSDHGETVLVEIAGEAGKALDFVQVPASKLAIAEAPFRTLVKRLTHAVFGPARARGNTDG